MKNRAGFTLAEVLITLGIIGVVAALTIPTLINNYQKTQYVTQLKKSYAQFNQVLKQMAADNGCIGNLKCTGFFDSGTDNDSLGDEIVKYIKVVKNCRSETGCVANNVSSAYDGSDARADWDDGGGYSFISADGTSYTIYNASNDCGTGSTRNVTNDLAQYCGDLVIDVNGPTKGPNNEGRDIFTFYIANGNGPIIYPSGGVDEVWWWNGNTKYCADDDKTGQSCTGRIIEEGWQMNY